METFAFRVRLRDAVTDRDADRLHEALDDEIGVEDGREGTSSGSSVTPSRSSMPSWMHWPR
jgi:hypothetical protein